MALVRGGVGVGKLTSLAPPRIREAAWLRSVWLAVAVAVAASPLFSQEAALPTDAEVKAAFLYNFAKFVRWPDDAPLGRTFVVAVLGEDPVGQVVERMLEGKKILDRDVEVRRIDALPAAGQIQILFLGPSERPRLAQVLKTLGGSSVLTVGDMEDFAERGGMIAFKLRKDIVQFDLNLDQVDRARLKMSSQVIRLARHVISTKRGSASDPARLAVELPAASRKTGRHEPPERFSRSGDGFSLEPVSR